MTGRSALGGGASARAEGLVDVWGGVAFGSGCTERPVAAGGDPDRAEGPVDAWGGSAEEVAVVIGPGFTERLVAGGEGAAVLRGADDGAGAEGVDRTAGASTTEK